MPTYPNPETLTPFRSDVPASEQCKAGDKIVIISDYFGGTLRQGTIHEVCSFSKRSHHIRIHGNNSDWDISHFAPLPSEEKTFDTLTLGEVEKWRVRNKATGSIHDILIAINSKFGAVGGIRTLLDLKSNYTLLPPEPIKTISRAEAEKLLNAKIV
jgi:hypothetical protein